MKKTDYKKTNNTTHKNVVAESKTGIYRNTQDAKDVYTDIDGYRITTLKKRKRWKNREMDQTKLFTLYSLVFWLNMWDGVNILTEISNIIIGNERQMIIYGIYNHNNVCLYVT